MLPIVCDCKLFIRQMTRTWERVVIRVATESRAPVNIAAGAGCAAGRGRLATGATGSWEMKDTTPVSGGKVSLEELATD